MSLSPKNIVNIQIQASALPPAKRNFGVGFILGTSAVLRSGDRVRSYTGIDGVAADFSDSSEEYLAAAAYYSQNPRPRDLKIGRLFGSGAAGYLLGGAVGSAADLAAINAVTDGGMDITINGTLVQLDALNFSTDANFSAVAARLQTALAAAVASTTCTYTEGKLIITSPTAVTGTVTVASAPTATATAIQAILKLTVATGASVHAPIATETVTQGLTNSWNFDPTFYGVYLHSSASAQDKKDAAAWSAANGLMYFYTTAESGALSAVDTTNLGYYFKGLGYTHVTGVYSTTNANAAMSLMGRFFVVNFDAPNSTITGKFKQLPGVTPDALTETQRLAVSGHNLNYYATFGTFTMVAEGVVANGRFIDEIIGLDWLTDAVSNGIFTILATSPTKIPQTDAGVARLLSGMVQPFNQARSNGLIAPGTWNGSPLGDLQTGDFLPTGYYVTASPVADQSESDRAARKAPVLSAVIIGAGAIHSVDAVITFQR